jgi:alpha-tubulin suppressor-like RCC1 family protein
MVIEVGRLDRQVMRKKPFVALALVFFLSGCGKTPAGLSPSQVVATTLGTVPTRMPTTTPALIPTTSPYQSPAGAATATPVVTAAAVAAGKGHTCAILSDGTVKCWGNNEHGQLGNGGTVNSNRPVDVIGVTDAAAITLGWGHTCVLTQSGGVKCWGYNANGELGNGATQDSSLPVDVAGLSNGAVAIDAGDDHTCAVTSQGRVMCWGYNEYGQLGDGTKASRSIPVEAQGFADGITAVAAGWGHTCILMDGGGVKCWGNNQNGQLGYGQDAEYRLTAVDVLGLGNGALEITADGGGACALVAGGGVKCWGSNKYGQLGDGTAEDRMSPVEVSGLDAGAVRVAAGWNHACAVTGNGELECWGWNYYGQLGDGTKTSRITPVRVAGLTDGIGDIGVGWGHTCVVTDLGGVRCWGLNENGQLGDGTTIDSPVPMKVFGISSALAPNRTNTPTVTLTDTPTPTNTPTNTPLNPPQNTPTRTPASGPVVEAIAITSEVAHTCALTRGGGVKCWGWNKFGQLGDGTQTDRLAPVDVVGLAGGMTAVSAGGGHTCAVTGEGGVMCWGNNDHGQLGNGSIISSNMPVEVKGLPGVVTALSAGEGHTCALLVTGGIMCWGDNEYGQLGDGTTMNRLAPVEVSGLKSSIAILASGEFHTCVVTGNGAVKCWGLNENGELGDGTITLRRKPANVIGLTEGVTALGVGQGHTCAVTSGGGVRCWGNNWDGQLGDGTTENHSTPTQVSGLTSGIAFLAGGYGHTCAVTVNGGVKCWGYNYDGQLGIGTSDTHKTPVDVIGLSNGVIALTSGEAHNCVLLVGGGVKCWGEKFLGDGSNTRHNTPVDVIGFGGPEAPISQPTPTYTNSTRKADTITPTPR